MMCMRVASIAAPLFPSHVHSHHVWCSVLLHYCAHSCFTTHSFIHSSLLLLLCPWLVIWGRRYSWLSSSSLACPVIWGRRYSWLASSSSLACPVIWGRRYSWLASSSSLACPVIWGRRYSWLASFSILPCLLLCRLSSILLFIRAILGTILNHRNSNTWWLSVNFVLIVILAQKCHCVWVYLWPVVSFAIQSNPSDADQNDSVFHFY